MLASAVFSPNSCFVFSPPNPIKKFYYRCDRKFHLDDLLKLYEVHEDYAIVLVSGKRTEFYLHNTNNTKLLKGIDESLPNQHKTGGQSAVRFERNRDEKIRWYVKKIVEIMVQFYVTDGKFKYKGIILAGPAEMKDMVRDSELFVQYFSKFLLKNLTIAEIDDSSMHLVIQMASDVLAPEFGEDIVITNFESKLSDPNIIDRIIFGTIECIAEFMAGDLAEIYVHTNSKHKDAILQASTKTKIIIIRSITFASKYGELVGIRHYADRAEDNYEVIDESDTYIEV
jgi:peptide subunit release factor 1 (eRF1)